VPPSLMKTQSPDLQRAGLFSRRTSTVGSNCFGAAKLSQKPARERLQHERFAAVVTEETAVRPVSESLVPTIGWRVANVLAIML
jgi:hypothetical protein